MSTLSLDLPVSEKIVTRWNSFTDDERRQWQDALAKALTVLNAGEDLSRILGAKFASDDNGDDWAEEAERADVRAALIEAIAESDAGLSIPLEQFVEERRAYWKERGISF